MTVEQTAINHRALIAAAARLERAGYDGDAYRFVESLIVSVLADGYRPVEKPPPLRPATPATDDSPGRRAFAEARAALAARRRQHPSPASSRTLKEPT